MTPDRVLSNHFGGDTLKRNDTDDAVDKFLAEKGVPYRIEFKPSVQPDAKKPSDLMIQWTAHVGSFSFDFHTGIGHLPEAVRPLEQRTRHDGGLERIMKEFRTVVCEGVTVEKRKPWHEVLIDCKPTAASVLYCLVLDAEALNHSGFEDWASTFGYDLDSRSAEKTYRACLDCGIKLRHIFGDVGIAELQVLLQDY